MNFDWLHAGGPVMYILLACSVVSVTITIERLIFFARDRARRSEKQIEQLVRLLSEGNLVKAGELAKQSRDPVVRIARFALAHPEESAEAALKIGAGPEIRRLRKFLRIHDTIITFAPLLGILGTVLGIIVTFDVIGASGGGGDVNNPIEVTGGIAQALLTTAAGLVVAILSLLPYNYFSARVEDRVVEMEAHLTSIEIALKKGGRRE